MLYRLRRVLLRGLFGQPMAFLYDTEIGRILAPPADREAICWLSRTKKLITWDSRVLALAKTLLGGALRKNPQLLCVGAHMGIFVIPLAERCKRVVAIEANPNVYELLKTSILINEKSNVEVHNVAAWHENITLNFSVCEYYTAVSRALPGKLPLGYRPGTGETIMRVPGAKLDSLLPGERFDLVLMDVEGAEANALRGATRIMKSAEVFLVEFVPHNFSHRDNLQVAELITEVEVVFDFLYSSTLETKARKHQFRPLLQHMYEKNLEDPALVFTKKELPADLLAYKDFKLPE